MDNPLLHVELTAKEQMRFTIKGDPVIVCQMIANVMNENREIAAAMIAAVCDYADRNGIPRDQIGNMVKFD